MQTVLIGVFFTVTGIAVAGAAMAATGYACWRIATSSYEEHVYKRGGSHAAGCVCPQCGWEDGEHNPACVCTQCGERGGRHRAQCICSGCGYSAGDHHAECVCPGCGAEG